MRKRILVGSVAIAALVTGGFTAASAEPTQEGGDCSPNYDPCVPDMGYDVDCAGGGGDGPEYIDVQVSVIGDDVFGLDDDGDGIGCETETGSTPPPTPAPAPAPAPEVEPQQDDVEVPAAPAEPVTADPDYTG